LSRTAVVVALALLAATAVAQAPAGSPVDRFGRLRVENLRLVAQNGRPVQLRGVSSHNIAGTDWLFNDEGLAELRDEWKADVIRLAMYTQAVRSGYLGNPGLEQTIDKIVGAAGRAGLYVIVDWHILEDGDPTENQAAAQAFFGRIAARYRALPNVLLEICNEPNGPGVTWDAKIRPYAVEVLKAIRAADPDRVVLVGTANWSQDVDLAARNPLPDPQVMYVFHWYAGTHGQALRNKVALAAKTVPLFNTEWGTTDSSGNGETYPAETAVWLSFLDRLGVSACNWSLSTVVEGSAALKRKFEQQGPMSQFLTRSGILVHDWTRAPRP